MPTLRPFRNIDEKDVVNRYAFSGTYPQNKGILVALTGSGWVSNVDPTEMLGAPGAAFGNTEPVTKVFSAWRSNDIERA